MRMYKNIVFITSLIDSSLEGLKVLVIPPIIIARDGSKSPAVKAAKLAKQRIALFFVLKVLKNLEIGTEFCTLFPFSSSLTSPYLRVSPPPSKSFIEDVI